MTAFYDDFQRANGALGSDWTTANGTPSISGGYAVGVAETYAVCNPVEDTDYQEVICAVAWVTGQTQTGGPLIKAAALGRAGYWAQFFYQAPNWYLAIFRRDASANTIIQQTQYPTTPPYLSTIRIVWNQGTITATVNGGYSTTVQDNTYLLNTRMGMRLHSASTPIADFRAFGTQAAALTVDPDLIGNYGACSTLTLTGTGTDWTVGTPGAPIFTVDHGTISAQEVTSSTTATITYCPGDYLGVVVFTDPSTGSTAGALVTSDPNVVPPSGFDERPGVEGGAMIDATAAHTSGDLTTSDMIVGLGIGGSPNLTLVQAIADLWYAEFRTAIDPPSGYVGSDLLNKLWLILNGGYEPPVGPAPAPGNTTVKQDTEGVVASLAQLRTGFGYTLDDVFTLLGGFPLLSHQDLKTAIDGISAGSNQDVLDMLLAMWGTSTPTLTDIATLISDISTAAGYTLADVLTAIAAQDVAGARADILAAIAALRGDNSSTVAGSYSLLVGMNVALQEVRDSLREVRAPSAYTFQDVLDAIAAIPGGTGGASAGAPVWPGIAGVTIGPAWPLSTGLTVTAPMDGVVVEIVAVAPKLNGHLYTYHDIACYRNVGALAFVSDRGDVETYQALGFTQAIYTPRYLKRAAAVKVMCPAGTAGSVRAWTVNP